MNNEDNEENNEHDNVEISGSDNDEHNNEIEVSDDNILNISSRIKNRKKRKTSTLTKTSKGKRSKSEKSKSIAALRSSFVWDFFVTENDIEMNVVYAICQVKDCIHKYIHHGSTSDYRKHLRDSHNITEASIANKTPEQINSLKKNPTQLSITEMFKKPFNPKQQNRLNQELVKFIIGTRQPLSIVENADFRTFCIALNSQFSVPCINTIKDLIDCSYHHMKNQIKETIIKSIQYVHLTFDLWSSRSHDSYLGITAHWIDKNFEIFSMVLDIGEIPFPHTAIEISRHVLKVFNDWDLESKIIIIVTDNGANVKSAVTKLEKEWIPCAAHTLQLSVNRGLKIVDPLIAKIKNLIFFLGNDKKRQQLRCAQIICNKIKESETIEIIKPIDIRWSSFYNSLVRLYELKNSIKWLANSLENSQTRVDNQDFVIMDQFLPTSLEWKVINELINLLAPAEQATKLLGGENYTTLAITMPIIKEVIQHFTNIKSSNITITNVKNAILSDLVIRWNIPNDFGIIASFLDPRFKNLTFCSSVSIYF